MQEKQLLLKQYARIGNVIPKNQVTLAIGLPGTGKTFTLIKFLNSESITPYLINLDESPVVPPLKAISLPGSVIIDFIKGNYTDLKDTVIIIDTYQLMMDTLGLEDNTDEDQKNITKALVDLSHNEQVTIIVIGHSEDFASKEGIFGANKYLVRACSEELIMTSKSTNKIAGNNSTYYATILKKGRGIGGAVVVDNWMR